MQHPKFNEFENVIVPGEVTGIGAVEGIIIEIKFQNIDSSFYYTVKCFSVYEIFYSHERFLSKKKLD